MDDSLVFGLGALDSPDDDRDWPAARLMALAAAEPDAAAPESWLAPDPQAPTYNQGSSPMCVAFGTGGDKVYDDLRDTGPFTPDFALFFGRIGGTSSGAVPRTALQQLVDAGYPPAQHPELSSRHRIASYARVEPDRASLCAAMPVLGPLLLSLRWHSSWYRPLAGGLLPAPDVFAGGHLARCVGWTAAGLVCVNSWGTAWGDRGRFTIPWAYLSEIKEAWATSDLVEPTALRWSLRVAARASVHHSSRTAAGLYVMPDRVRPWGPTASSAGCSAPKRIRTTKGQTITAVAVTSGVFKGRWVHLGPGVTAQAKGA